MSVISEIIKSTNGEYSLYQDLNILFCCDCHYLIYTLRNRIPHVCTSLHFTFQICHYTYSYTHEYISHSHILYILLYSIVQ